jgi:hypothetical protein
MHTAPVPHFGVDFLYIPFLEILKIKNYLYIYPLNSLWEGEQTAKV